MLPASYAKGDYYLSVLFLISSIGISLLTFIVLSLSHNQIKNKTFIYNIYPPKYLNTIIYYTTFLSIISVCFIIFDRIIIQGIDYSKGVVFAREQWRIVGEDRDGFSSVFSLIGNMLSGFPIILASLLYLYYERLNGRVLFISLIGAILTIGGSTFLTGGRSIVMMFSLSLLLIGLIRRFRGIGFIPKKTSTFLRINFSVIFISAFIYTVYVFHLRAVAGGNSSLTYMVSTLEHLGGKYLGEERYMTSFMSDVVNYLNITGAYLVHSVWTLQSILDLNNYDGVVTFTFYRVNLARVIDMKTSTGWDFSGLFSTYLGAFYYDYGLGGAILSSILIGVLMFVSTLILYSKDLTILHIGIFLSSMYIVMLSPLLFAADIMSFPFILFGFCMLYLLSIFSRIRLFSVCRGG